MTPDATEAQRPGIAERDLTKAEYVHIPSDLSSVLFIRGFSVVDLEGIKISDSFTEGGQAYCVCLNYPDWKGNHILISVTTYGSMLIEWKHSNGRVDHRYFNQNTGSYIYGMLKDLFDALRI